MENSDLDVLIRPCGPEDAFALALVGAATFLEAFAGFIPGEAILAHSRKNHIVSAYEGYFARAETRGWLVEVEPGGAPVGYALLTAPDFPEGLAHPGDLELRRIYLFTRFHGSGAGRRMMELAIAGAREQGAKRLLLGVHPENRRALAFYKKTGFVPIGKRIFQVGQSLFEDPVLALEL